MRQDRAGLQAAEESPGIVPDPVSEVPTETRRRPATTRLWAVASGKGGVGRSFLAANLGCVLARDVAPVVVADLDFGGGNLHTFLGQSAGPSGLGAFLSGQVGKLDDAARAGEVPGLSLLQGIGGVTPLPNSRSRARLLTALRRLESPLALLDLESGAARPVLDFFIAADRPILVVLPEPAAVENAHRFIRQVYMRQLELLVRARGIDRNTLRREVEALEGGSLAPWKPTELLRRLERNFPGLGRWLQDEIARFRIYLLVNQVHHLSDVHVGVALKGAVQSYFGFGVRYVGAIRYDAEAWWSARRRRLRVREASAEALNAELEQVVQNLLEDREFEPPEGEARL